MDFACLLTALQVCVICLKSFDSKLACRYTHHHSPADCSAVQ